MIEVNARIMPPDEVKKFFLDNLYQLFEKSKEQISFFGIEKQGRDLKKKNLLENI